MAQAATATPLREDFAAMLEESFTSGNLQEGSVIKGTVVGIEKDVTAEIRILQAMATIVASVPGGKNSGWGQALRSGIDKLSQFRQDFNRQMDLIKDERVNVTARAGITWTAEASKFRQAAGRMAVGGPVQGPGTSTSDSIPTWLSSGEHVWSAREVAGMGGHATMAAMRAQARGMASGGAVDPHLRIDNRVQGDSIDRMVTGLAKGFSRAVGRALVKAMGAVPGNFGSGSWMRAISELHADNVPFSILSTFRAGARTHASGAVSYHALNRAVDLRGPNLLNIWAALTDTNPTELIYSGANSYKSRSGWHPIGRLDPITLADHWDHVHAAYDKGGWLKPGWTMAYNGTGRSEPVGFDYDRLGQAVARALQAVPPVVAVDDVHQGLLAKKRRNSRIPLGLS